MSPITGDATEQTEGDAMTATQEPYTKAMWTDRMVPYYDTIARLLMRERRIKRRVVAATRLAPAGRLLDIGCGTGTLALLAKRMRPSASIVGLDGDPAILALARRKAAAAGLAVQFDEGMSYDLPYADGSFDAATSTLMLHHLTPSQRERTLRELWRVLCPGGRLVIADLAPPHNRLMSLAGRPLRLLAKVHPHGKGHAHSDGEGHGEHHQEHAGPSIERHLPERLAAMGWSVNTPPEYFMTLVGTLALYAATRP
jgi:ubiquinone/menaquinone biosynthesis C-methylase UbiE